MNYVIWEVKHASAPVGSLLVDVGLIAESTSAVDWRTDLGEIQYRSPSVPPLKIQEKKTTTGSYPSPSLYTRAYALYTAGFLIQSVGRQLLSSVKLQKYLPCQYAYLLDIVHSPRYVLSVLSLLGFSLGLDFRYKQFNYKDCQPIAYSYWVIFTGSF